MYADIHKHLWLVRSVHNLETIHHQLRRFTYWANTKGSTRLQRGTIYHLLKRIAGGIKVIRDLVVKSAVANLAPEFGRIQCWLFSHLTNSKFVRCGNIRGTLSTRFCIHLSSIATIVSPETK
jgi:hypothetical protein